MMRVRKARVAVRVMGILLVALLCSALAAAQANKRLVLKDGTWQDVKKYEVQGDRVRYLSSHRLEWEEVPKEMVDWEATEKWNAQQAKLEPEDEAEVAKAPDPLQIAPGVRLPKTGGVFVLDNVSGQRRLVELNQEQGAWASDNSGVFHSSFNRRGTMKQRLELKGLHAKARVHVAQPVIFIKLADSEVPAEARFRIAPLVEGKDSRVMGTYSLTLAGKQREEHQFLPVRVENFGQGWLRITPSEALKGGEYAVVEMLDQNRLNVFAWDFGVDAPQTASNADSSAQQTDKTSPPKH